MLVDLLRPRTTPVESRGMNEYLRLLERFSFGGISYTLGSNDYRAAEYVSCNAAVSAVVNFRVSVFAEATFKFQNFSGSRPGTMFGTPELAVLENPWPGAGTEHLLAAMEVDLSAYGNSYWIRRGDRLYRLEPEHVTIVKVEVLESGVEVSDELVGYAYKESHDQAPAIFLPDEVAHFRLKPDPDDPFRGVSWMRGIMDDARADEKMTGYKTALLDNSAVPGLVMRAEPGVSIEQIQDARDALKARNTGWDKVGRTLVLGAGFDVKSVGLNLQQLDMKSIQGAGESRIAAAAGVSPVLVGFSEGLQGSSLNAGNYGAARRRFADGTVRPLWRAACTALSTLITVPAGTRLWFDDRDVSFLQEDVKDAAEIKSREALTIESLIRSGFTPDTVVQAVITGDYSVLTHTGLYSVQLQAPGAGTPPARELAPVVETRETEPLQQQFTFHIDSRPDIPAATVNVDVQVPEQRAEAPVVNVNVPTPDVHVSVEAPAPVEKSTVRSVERDDNGRIVRVIDEVI